MKERPILFSAPMVLALLAGTKTQTRRNVKPQPENPGTFGISPIWGSGVLRSDPGARFHVHAAFNVGGKRVDRWLPCPQGAAGDRLWVRETTIISPQRWSSDWALIAKENRREDDDGHLRAVQYLATAPDREAANGYGLKATPSIFMPRWASRITLEVTGVRVERLQDISEADAKAEGLQQRPGSGGNWAWSWPGGTSLFESPRACYWAGWDTINGAGAAAKNPWVWAIDFRRVKSG